MQILGRQSCPAMMFQRDPDIVETVKRRLIQAASLAGDSQRLPPEVNGGGLRLITIFAPIRIYDWFYHVGVEQRCQRGQALDRHAEPNRHARHCDKFGPAGSDRYGATGLDTFAAKAAVRLGEPLEIAVKVPAQPLGEGLPGGLGLLNGRLGEPLQRPAIDCTRAGIPRPCQKAPSGIVRCQCGGLGAIAPILIQGTVVDRRRTNAAGRAVADEAIEPVPYAAIQQVTEACPLCRCLLDGDGWGRLLMYMVVIWEIVNSIYLEYTYANLPNLGSSSFLVKYSDVF